MATRRTRTRQTKRTQQTQQTRRGSGWWSRKARSLGLYDAGPSTSLLAREIYAMLGPNGIKDYRQGDFENLMIHHPNVNRSRLLKDLKKVGNGITPKQEYEVVANLNFVLPPQHRELTYNQ